MKASCDAGGGQVAVQDALNGAWRMAGSIADEACKRCQCGDTA